MGLLVKKHFGLLVYIILTIVYTFIVHFIYEGALNTITSFVGVFVPASLFVTAFTLGLAPLLMLAYFIFFDLTIWKLKLETSKILFLIFASLFFFTLCFDFILFGEAVSIKAFLGEIGLIHYNASTKM